MTSIDASMAAIALVNDPHPSTTPGPDKNLLIHIGDRFVGRYVCGQGPTDLTIKLDSIGRGDAELEVEATAEFTYDGSTGQPEAEGSFRAVGIFDPRTRRLHLKGDTWIDRPSGYSLVNFLGTVSKKGETYSGSVEGSSCGSFTTTRAEVGD